MTTPGAGPPRRCGPTAAALLALLLTTGCVPDEPQVPEPAWQEIGLPAPPGPPGRIALRDAAFCDGRWYLAGGVFTTDDGDGADDALGAPVGAYPAAWTGTDGRKFESVEIRADTYWGGLATLTSIACAAGRGRGAGVVAVGARSGGAHGNPRVTTFHGPAGGPLEDVRAATTLFGGSEALAVNGVTAGPEWLVTGARTTGGAVWTSEGGARFTPHDDDPALASGGGLDTMPADAAYDAAAGTWHVVGSAHRDGRVAPVPVAWSSADAGAWTREDVPPPEGYGSLERVVVTARGPLAIGVAGDRFGVWRREAGRWRAVTRFGDASARDAPGIAYVSGLAVVPGRVLATVSDGARFALWSAPDDDGPWRPVVVPETPGTGADHLLTVAARGSEVLLLSDDESGARAWTTTWPAAEG
ncbi:hypothetical protein [Myceligenerans crystallogenes]|uniref:Uncharacterized protein n=1 Tax=Myceligenerans crystallogenes TaxID=316335 RepID=A0ABN2NF84_9MICO